MLARGGIQRTFSQLVGVMAYWLVMLVVLVAALNALQLTATAELLILLGAISFECALAFGLVPCLPCNDRSVFPPAFPVPSRKKVALCH